MKEKDYLGKDTSLLKRKKSYLFDMDGTIYFDNQLFDGTIKLLEKIEREGGRYVFITNNSSKSVTDYVNKLSRLGIKVELDNFYTSSQATVRLLKDSVGEGVVYAQGTRSFINELKCGGITVTEDYDESAKAIVVGFDTELNFEKLYKTSKMLTKVNVPYYATNPDWVCPVEFGYVPDCGSMCFGLEKASGRKPEFIGKPMPTMINSVMKKFGNTKEETVVIGDRIYTDIASGYNAGVDTVLVLSGESTMEDYKENPIKPTFVLNSIKEMI